MAGRTPPVEARENITAPTITTPSTAAMPDHTPRLFRAAGEAEPEPFPVSVRVLALIMEADVGILPACTSYEKLSLVFGVEVDEHLAREESALHSEGAVHAGFL